MPSILRSQYGPPPSMKSPKLPSGAPTPRSNSIAKSIGSPSISTKTSKTKGASFFGFLTVKEPSARALLDYEEHVRKQTQIHSGRLTAVGMPGVSSARLPATVPKVNSKWDGVPQAVKEKEKENQAHRRRSSTLAGRSFRASSSAITHSGNDHAQFSSSTLGSEASRRNGGTGSSVFSSQIASQSSLGTMSGWEDGSISSGSDTRDLYRRNNLQSLSSYSSTTLAESTPLTSYGSGNQMMAMANEGGTLADLGYFPPVPRLTESDPLRSVESAASVASRTLPLTTASSRGGPTPAPHENTISRTSSPSSRIPQADVSVKSSGTDVLGPPATVRPKVRLQPGEVGSANSVQGEPSHSILRREGSRPARPPMSSYFRHPAVEIGGVRPTSGLGMSTEVDLVAPWETEGVPSRPDAGRDLPPVAPSGRGLLKRGRLAIFKK